MWFSQICPSGSVRARLRSVALTVAVAFTAACQDQPTSTAPNTDAALAAARGASGKVVTSDPGGLATAVRGLRHRNELLVWIRESNVAPLAPEALTDLPLSANLVVGVPAAPANAARRRKFTTPRVRAQSVDAVLRMLDTHGVRPYRERYVLPVVAIRVADQQLEAVLTALLHHPNVDYVEANQGHVASPDAGPVGTNPVDIKHTFHNITGAWDHTRGGLRHTRVGVLDSGFPQNVNGQYHRDGSTYGTYGIGGKGFTNDYANCSISNQQAGVCAAQDDHGHGTAMAGIVGSVDNEFDYVGVMPFGQTWSFKMTHNTAVSGQSCNGASTTYCIEDDDFVAAVDYASYINTRVLSMSFSSDFGTSVYNALSRAYYTHDILLLSSTGNRPEQKREPQNYPFVMGVGGLDENGNSLYNEEYEDISAISAGGTTGANCTGYSFCTPATSAYFSSSRGGTSISTAVAAGIAGLVRDYHHTETAPQIWNRLVASSVGPHHRLDALAAITHVAPLTVFISGPTEAFYPDFYTWEAFPSGGGGVYGYQWSIYYYNTGLTEVLGTQKQQTRYIDPAEGEFAIQVSVTGGSQVTNASLYVTTFQPPPPECGPMVIC